MSISKAIFEIYASHSAENQKQVDYLTDLLDHWDCNEVPLPLGFLSSGERDALLIAADREAEVDSPIATLLNLDPHLQKWVMQRRGFSNQIGWPLGEAPNFG